VGFIAGAVVVGGLAATFVATVQTRKSLQNQIGENSSLQVQVTKKSDEAKEANQEASTVKTVLSATVENLQAQSPAVSASATSALDKAFDADPEAAKLLVRVYIHIHGQTQQTRAADVADALRKAGDLVPGIDVQPQSFKVTEVHYYASDSQSLSDTDAIVKVVAGTGIPVEKRQVPPAKTDKLKPRAYGLWLAADLK
jgi:cell division protein FtsX